MGLKDVHWMLNRLVDYQFSMSDSGWPTMAAFCRGYVQQGRAGSKVLCPDMPPDLVIYQRAFLALDQPDQQVITVKYMPYVFDGKPATPHQRAKFMGLSPRRFNERYQQAARKVKRRQKTLLKGLS